MRNLLKSIGMIMGIGITVADIIWTVPDDLFVRLMLGSIFVIVCNNKVEES